MTNQKGFTIVELIVVVATIAVLAAIVLTNVNQYAAKARDAKRIADTKNILKALMMYQADYGCVPKTIGNSCGPATGNYTASDAGGWDSSSQGGPFLTFLATAGYLKVVPADPINNMPGDATANTYAYRYYCYSSDLFPSYPGVHLEYYREAGGWAQIAVNGGGYADAGFICK
jgi:prepilin-type N-terminal cleavage/methylation domain-containing protein